MGPLNGVRVVDLTRVLAGPFGTAILGDLGAEIIKVEPPESPDPVRDVGPYINGQSHYFLSVNRNKSSLSLDFRDPQGLEILLKLLESADVLVENYRPGVLRDIGLDPNMLKKRYPHLILCSISGFGQTGPKRGDPSFDLVTQALSGAMSVTGEPGRQPVRLGIPMGDLIGGLYGAIAVCAALYQRDQGNGSSHIDLALLDGLVSLMGYMAARYFATGEILGPVGGGHHTSVPYDVYEASDGYIAIACMTDKFWKIICDVIGLSEMGKDDRYSTYDQRRDQRDRINDEISRVIKGQKLEEWTRVFEDNGVPHAPILDVAQAIKQPQIVEREMVRQFTHPDYGTFDTLASPIKFDGDPNPLLKAPPILGQDTDDILEGIGFGEKELQLFHENGIVSDPKRGEKK